MIRVKVNSTGGGSSIFEHSRRTRCHCVFNIQAAGFETTGMLGFNRKELIFVVGVYHKLIVNFELQG